MLPHFDAFRNYRFGQGLAVALLGLAAISYSPLAELSLWAGVRSDRVAKRAATSNVAMNVRDKYQRAKFVLDGLPAARSAAERLDRRNVLGGIPHGSVPSRLEPAWRATVKIIPTFQEI